MSKNPMTITIYGRLSFPVFGLTEAIERNKQSAFPQADSSRVTPEFHLLLEPAQQDKFLKHVQDLFLPEVAARSKAGEKRNALSDKEIKRITDLLDSKDWENQPPYIPLKPINEKTLALAPECVSSLKVVGNRGMDIVQKAIVRSEDELAIPDEDILSYPVVLPIQKTTHQLYPGCYAAATLNLYSFISGKLPGFSASASTCVFKADGTRFGGGVEIDEDEMFLD